MIATRTVNIACALILVGSSQPATPSPGAEDTGQGRPPYLAARLLRSPAAAMKDLGSGAELVSKEHQLALGLIRFTAGNTRFDLGLDYEYTHFDYAGVNSRDRDLHRLQAPLKFESRLSGWRLKGFVAPGVSTSSNIFKDFLNRGSREDAFATVRTAIHRDSEGAQWFAGVAYDRSFGKPLAYPVAGVSLAPTTALRVRLAFPDPAFELRLSDRQSVQGRVFPAGHQWRVVSDDLTRSFDYRVETLRADLNWNLRIWRKLSIDIGVGYDTRREHHFADDQGVPLDPAVASEWLVAVGIRIGPAMLPYAHGAGF